MSNLRNSRTTAYNKLIDDLWEEELKKYKENPLLKNVNLSNIENIHFEDYHRNHVNYANQIYNLYYFNKINDIILSDDDDDNKLIDQIGVFKTLKDLKAIKLDFYLNYRRRYMAVYKIQQWWKPIFYNPRNNLMDTMIDNHFNEYNEYNNLFKKRKLSNN